MLTILIWDVQHGNAVHIKTPASKHIVQDLGTGSHKGTGRDFSPLLHLKHKYDIYQLDEVIITHPHGDHLDDIVNFDRLRPRALHRPNHVTNEEIWAGNQNADPNIIQRYLEINDRYNQPFSDGENPNLPSNNGGVDIRFFVSRSCSRSNLNNHSVVTVISYETCKVLIPGDNESPSWHELLKRDDFIEAISGTDILVAPHHGRDAGFYGDIFNYFKPKLTVISDGRFGDTSATSRYDQVTQGWEVHQRDGQNIKRKCVTTRADGVINISIGRDPADGRVFISVTID